MDDDELDDELFYKELHPDENVELSWENYTNYDEIQTNDQSTMFMHYTHLKKTAY